MINRIQDTGLYKNNSDILTTDTLVTFLNEDVECEERTCSEVKTKILLEVVGKIGISAFRMGPHIILIYMKAPHAQSNI